MVIAETAAGSLILSSEGDNGGTRGCVGKIESGLETEGTGTEGGKEVIVTLRLDVDLGLDVSVGRVGVGVGDGLGVCVEICVEDTVEGGKTASSPVEQSNCSIPTAAK